MCLSPRRKFTNAKNLTIGSKLQLSFACGRCAECVENKRREWSFRTYHEVQSAFNNGCYVYVDTLTYSDSFLPRISQFIDVHQYGIADISCFNNKHYQDFLKRLRSSLKYQYKVDKIRYFLTSEYGTDERYTKRPHYHIMFFVPNIIHPLTFSRLVSSAWLYGRTEGIAYKPFLYVRNNVFGYDLGDGKRDSKMHVLRVSSYISKYVTKDQYYNKTLVSKLNYLQENLDDEKFKEIRKHIDMIHRQSVGFGASFLSCCDVTNYVECAYMEDGEKIVCTIPLPMYYQRKLYYTNKYRIIDGKRKYYWELNEHGLEKYAEKIFKQVERKRDELHLLHLNMMSDKLQYDIVTSLLADRTFEDLAIYDVIYKDRLHLSQTIVNLDTEKQIHLHKLANHIHNENIPTVDLCNLDDKPYIDDIRYVLYNPLNQKYEKFTQDYLKSLSYSENTHLLFKDFDKLLQIFENQKLKNKHYKQSLHNLAEKIWQLRKNKSM